MGPTRIAQRLVREREPWRPRHQEPPERVPPRCADDQQWGDGIRRRRPIPQTQRECARPMEGIHRCDQPGNGAANWPPGMPLVASGSPSPGGLGCRT
jgi:hypothetical protein